MVTNLSPEIADLFVGAGQPPVAQRQLFEALWMKGEVPIPALIQAVQREADGQRNQQQVLGPYITRLNRRLKKARLAVRPGRMKGTYCVVRL